MNLFLKKTLIFIFVIVGFLSPPFFILKCSGESYTSYKLIINKSEDYLVGFRYNDDAYRYIKWYTISSKLKHNIISLGSSRVLQFRKEMFSSSFYNSGMTIFRITEFLPYLKSIPPEKLPNYIIMGLDQWMFNENYDDAISNIFQGDYWSKEYINYPTIKTYAKVYKEITHKAYGFEVLAKDTTIDKVGINAKKNIFGLRSDGSFSYSKQIINLCKNDSISFASTIDRINNHKGYFSYASKINSNALKELKNILDFCKSNNIYIIAFCPPYPDQIYNKMIETGNYSYLLDLNYELNNIFQNYNFEFYNYHSASSCNSNDNEFIDGFHGSEVTYARLLLDMLTRESILNQFVDIDSIREDIKHKKNNYVIY